MDEATIKINRGICQLPACIAYEKGFFEREGINVTLEYGLSAWMFEGELLKGEIDFAYIPWTRVAVANIKEKKLMIVSGSGKEEAVIVAKTDLPEDLNLAKNLKIALPIEGGMKDLTGRGMIKSLGLKDYELVRCPSGDSAQTAFIYNSANVSSMVEPYGTALEELGIGKIIKTQKEIWPGSPGCSLTTTYKNCVEKKDLVQRVVNAFVEGAKFAHKNTEEASIIGEKYIIVNRDFVKKSLERGSQPDYKALIDKNPQEEILNFMRKLGYIKERPLEYFTSEFLSNI